MTEMRVSMLLCLLLAPATAFFRPQNGGAVAWNSSPLQKDNVFDSHVQARHVKSSTKSAKSSKESSKSRRTKSSKAGSIGSSSSGSNSAGSETKGAKQDSPSSESESISTPESTISSTDSESSSTASEESTEERSSDSEDVTVTEERSRDSEDVLNGGTGDAMDGRNPGVHPPSPSPTCVECDDYPGEDKKVEPVPKPDTLVVNVAPPSPSPTCVECDDGPKPTRPPSFIPLPEKNPTASSLSGTGTLLDVKTDGERDPQGEILPSNYGDEISASQQMLSVSALCICGAGFLLSLWYIM